MNRLLSCVSIFVLAGAASAADGVAVRRGADVTVFGNCVPSLTVENKSNQTIDYLQVDLALSLANGERRLVELKSAYREGVLFPIAPGGQATLKQQLDMSVPTGVPCSAIQARLVVRTLCESNGGKPCTLALEIDP
jgi:hypothetical protein